MRTKDVFSAESTGAAGRASAMAARAGRPSQVYQFVPALGWLGRYSGEIFVADLLAGLTVAAVAVPQAMAYATLAGVRPEYGLYSAIVVTLVGALLDSSRLLINGPTNAISISLLSAVAVIPAAQRPAAVTLLALMMGVIQIAVALIRLGDLTRYVSHSVILGFTFGAAVLLVLDQAKNFLGLAAGGTVTDNFLRRFWLTMTHGGPVNWITVLIGVGSIAIALGLREINTMRQRRKARFPIPQHLVAIVVMASLVRLLHLDTRFGVRIVGQIPARLPRFELPWFDWEQARMLSSDALAIALLGLLEAVAMSKAIARRSGQALDVNQQCLSEGVANFVGSLFHCIPGSGSLTRSVVNEQAGAVTQWSGVFCAVAVAATVVLFGPLARYVPQSSLAAILILAGARMVDWKQLLFHLRATRFDAGLIAVTAASAVFVSVEFCIIIGVLLSFVLYLPRVSHVTMTRLTRLPGGGVRPFHPDDGPARDLAFALEGELFFGSEPQLCRHLESIEQAVSADTESVLLVLHRARNPDATFLTTVAELETHLKQRGVRLTLCGVQADLERAMQATGLDRLISRDRAVGAGPGDDPGFDAAATSGATLHS